MGIGKVFLVGAGPGEVGLITVKGLEAIKQADVILYDRLANPKLLQFAPPGCELIYGGKLPDRHILRQDAINRLLVEKALEGKVVVRLKGGDPGVFGRVGEEAEALADQGISYDIVPGVTSGMAAPLYAGIPVTHREFGESFAVVTAHDKSKNGQPNLDWKSFASGIDTIAFYMGISNLPYICDNLIAHGKRPDTPVILIQWGTFGRQKTLEGTLETIAEKVAAEKFSNPAITLVGDIVSVRNKLSWFEKKPLFGRQILLARTGTNESSLARELDYHGADVIEFPRWKKVKAPVDEGLLARIGSYGRILFTSPESVTDFFEVLFKQGIDIRNITADLYGGSTKSVRALNEKGLKANLLGEMQETGELLIVGDSSLQNQFKENDFYMTSTKEIDAEFLPIFNRMFEEATVNTVIFPSGASVKQFMKEGVESGLIPEETLRNSDLVCLGQNSEEALKEFHYQADLIPDKPDKASLIECLAQAKNSGILG
ncbi:uroporphyrinogen-III C-methyltransferase [Mesobacillus foraminis]|uniref:uroporphyrinogen-III C-methyltransferase n=1 Tax=Mesobacillus foraminis TaxID=279826 RepID=UPI0039A30E87